MKAVELYVSAQCQQGCPAAWSPLCPGEMGIRQARLISDLSMRSGTAEILT